MQKDLSSEYWFEFSTDSMDTLGQGVSRNDPLKQGQVSFISKSLPGEKGKAKCFYQKKKWKRGILTTPQNLTQISPNRIDPLCPHFNECFGCHYLHTSYQNELNYKKLALKQALRKFQLPEIEVLPAENRDYYRNRIQWHYHLEQKLIGQNGPFGIIPVPNCRLPCSKLDLFLKDFLQKSWWDDPLFLNEPNKGHIEFYLDSSEKVQISANQPYAHLGFSQVNFSMNQILLELLTKTIKDCLPEKLGPQDLILELFGGKGNLTQKINAPILICDSRSGSTSSTQKNLEIDLYAPFALKKILEATKNQNILGMILDPPRSGFKNLEIWADKILTRKKSWFIYVSCSPDTLARDIDLLLLKEKKFFVQKIYLLDMFPGTHHFETIALFNSDLN